MRIDGILGPPGGVLDRTTDEARGSGEQDRFGAGLRLIAKTVLEVCRHRQRGRFGDGPRVHERFRAIDRSFAVRLADGVCESGARRGQRLESERREHLRRPRIPGIGNREYPRLRVQGFERFSACCLRFHDARSDGKDRTTSHASGVPVSSSPRSNCVLAAEARAAYLARNISRVSSSSSSRSSRALCAPWVARMSSSSLTWIASVSRLCVFWIRKTIRNVTIVVP